MFWLKYGYYSVMVTGLLIWASVVKSPCLYVGRYVHVRDVRTYMYIYMCAQMQS